MAEIPANKIDGVALSSVGPGHRLRDARKLGNLDQSDIATQLNLDIATINALEKDEYANMPPAVFVRGYLRAYANMVGLPVDDILASFDALQGIDPVERNYRAPTRISATGAPAPRRSPIPLILALIVLAALAAGGYYAWQLKQSGALDGGGAFFGEDQESPVVGMNLSDPVIDPGSDPVMEATPEPLPDVIGAVSDAPIPVASGTVRRDIDAAERAATDRSIPNTVVTGAVESDATETDVTTADPVPAAAADSSATDSGPAPVTVVEDDASEPAPQAAAATSVSASVEDRLTLTYSDNCWTQVRDGAGKRLAFGVMKPGQVLELSGVAPFDVTLGQSDGVSVEFNGKPFDHKRFSRGKIARFQIADDGAIER